MKKVSSLILFLTILFTVSFSFADAQNDFIQFAMKVTQDAPAKFFTAPSGVCFPARFSFTKSAEEIFAEEKSRCAQTATKLYEFEYILLTTPEISGYFGGLEIKADLTQPSYVGRDGSIISCYVQGADCGYFTLYDLSTHLMYAVPVSPKSQKKVESVLFERCADGYFVNNSDVLKEEMDYFREMYDKALDNLISELKGEAY